MTTTDVIRFIRGLIKDTLRTDGNKAYDYQVDPKFTIPEPFVDATSINVYQNGDLLSTDDWDYSSTTNQVTITFVTSGKILVNDDTILITFSYYGKYSENEILNYLEASLVYFVQYRYEKVFQLNSSDKIVTVNGVNPSIIDFQRIALIASISIDPDNITIKTKEFTINGSTEKSKDDLIKEAFKNFQRNFGILNFVDYDRC